MVSGISQKKSSRDESLLFRRKRKFATPARYDRESFMGMTASDATDSLNGLPHLRNMLCEVALTAFTHTTAEEFFRKSITALVAALGCNHGALLRKTERLQSRRSVYRCCASAPGNSLCPQIPANSLPWLKNELRKNRVVQYASVDAVPAHHDRSVLTAHSCKSLLCIPLFVRNALYGFLWFAETQFCRTWQGAEVAALRSAAHIMSQTISMKQAEEQRHINSINFCNAMEYVTDGVCIISRKYRVEYANSALQKAFGPLHHQKCYAYFNNRSTVCPWCLMKKNLTDKSVFWNWYFAKNNKTYEIITAPYLSDNGSRVNCQIFHDVTDILNAKPSVPPFQSLSAHYINFTPTEITVSDLILEGKANKEIASSMHVSGRTIEFHRKNIRRKLGIHGKKINLRTYLTALA